MIGDSRLIAGAMSGTSADGVDVALVRISGSGLKMSARLVRLQHRPYPAGLRREIGTIRAEGSAKFSKLAEIGREISLCYAAAVNEALVGTGLNAADLTAVAAHGQTIYHDPPNTIQWLDPALVAGEVGAAVVSDFRRADCAAGGQGAPLVPFADLILFRSAELDRVLLNIGGIANVTFLRAAAGINDVVAYDTGPGNCLSDHLCRDREPGFDEGGKIAARGKAIDSVVREVLAAEYFAKPPPKSTDGPAMIQLFDDAIKEKATSPLFEDLLHSACAIAAEGIARAIREFSPDEVIASGGGTENRTLISILEKKIGKKIRKTEEFGIPSTGKEAMAFALLGAATLDGVAGNVPAATGAQRGVVLGSITPKP
jgi:anhydro-N-acetylmuramic acid kinase